MGSEYNSVNSLQLYKVNKRNNRSNTESTKLATETKELLLWLLLSLDPIFIAYFERVFFLKFSAPWYATRHSPAQSWQ